MTQRYSNTEIWLMVLIAFMSGAAMVAIPALVVYLVMR